jgi:hypothetical protein
MNPGRVNLLECKGFGLAHTNANHSSKCGASSIHSGSNALSRELISRFTSKGRGDGETDGADGSSRRMDDDGDAPGASVMDGSSPKRIVWTQERRPRAGMPRASTLFGAEVSGVDRRHELAPGQAAEAEDGATVDLRVANEELPAVLRQLDATTA